MADFRAQISGLGQYRASYKKGSRNGRNPLFVT